LYYTESASDVEINRVAFSLLLNPSGRLIHLNRQTKKATVLLDRLYFANGIALSPNEDFVIVSDLGRSKIIRYILKADAAVTFAENLPGFPDNIMADKNGIWVALPITGDPDHPIYFQKLAQFPTVRKFLARLLYLTESFFKSVDQYAQNEFSKQMSSHFSAKLLSMFMSSKRATILRLNWKGETIAEYHSFDSAFYTHVLEVDGKLYLGSFTNDYIARVNRRDHA
jgi:hypothetical protein